MSKTLPPIAIDIGTSAVKVAQVYFSRGRVGEVRKALVALPQGWQPGSDPGPVQDALEIALRQAGVKGDRYILILPRQQVTLRFTQLPPSRPEELQKMAALEAEEHIPLPPADTVVSCEILAPAEGETLAPVLIAAARKEVIQSYLSLLAALKIRPERITGDSLCLFHLWQKIAPDPSPAFLLDLGARGMVVNYLEAGRLQMSRTVGGGGEALTKAFQADYNLGFAEAEQLKLKQGLRSPDEPGQSLPENGKVAEWLRTLIGEVRRSALSLGGQTAPARIYLTGGASLTAGLEEALAVALGRPVSLLSPGEPLSPAEGAIYALACAASSVSEKPGNLNLLPSEDRLAEKDFRRRRATTAVGLAALIALVSFGGGASLLLKQREDRLAREKNEWQEAQRVVTQARSLETKRTLLISQLDNLSGTLSGKQLFMDILLEVSGRAPRGTSLTSLTLERLPKASSRECTLRIAGKAPDTTAVANLVLALSQIKGAQAVNVQNISGTSLGDSRGVEFNLTGHFILPDKASPVSAPEGEKQP
jgi:type IV pilus assembly protein PilM